jgi:hypothetical protein
MSTTMVSASSWSLSADSHVRRSTSLLLAAALVASALTVAASPASACSKTLRRGDVYRSMRNGDSLDAGVVRASGGMETIALLTFDLEVAKTKPTYSIGDVVAVDVTVTRPAKEDPLGNGIPMDRPYVEPVAGAIVGVGLYIGRVFLPGAAITGADGVAHVKIKLEDYAPAGKKVDTSIYAWRVVQETTCATVQEYGYTTVPGQFKTAP